MRKELINKLIQMMYCKDDRGRYSNNPDKGMKALGMKVLIAKNLTWEENEEIMRTVRTNNNSPVWEEQEYYYYWESAWAKAPHPNNPKRTEIKQESMVKGNQKETGNVKNVGFTLVKLKAVNPTRTELNKLLGKEDSPDDKEITYLSQDQEGNNRVRLSFWLHDEKLDKYFVHSFNLTNKERKSRDGVKSQFVNSSCITAWDETGKNLPDWFTYFIDKEGAKIADKVFRKALLGEEELVTLLRLWLGRMTWRDKETKVMIDTEALFNEDYTELRSLINSKYDTSFVILTGVRTDINDLTKQYQQVYGKAFLPGSFMTYIESGFKFPNDYAKKVWAKFETDVTGQYGFDAYFELTPIKEYNPDEDITIVESKPGVTPINAKF